MHPCVDWIFWVPQRLKRVEIWGIWRPRQHFELLVMFHKPFLFFSYLSYSIFCVRRQVSLNSLPWAPMSLILVHQLSFPAPVLVDTTAYGEHPTRLSFLKMLWSSHSHHYCENYSYLLACPFFLLPTHKSQEITVHLLFNISHPLTDAIVTTESVLFT